MLNKLRRTFVLLSTSLTGLVLLAACLLAFSLSKMQIESTNLEAFEYQSQTLSVLLAGSKQLDHSQIYRMEKDSQVYIYLFDNGNPVRITSNEDAQQRESLYTVALSEMAAGNAGIQVAPTERTSQPVNITANFNDAGGAYLAKYISAPIGSREWYSIILIKPVTEQRNDILRTALLYAGIFIVGLVFLFLISRALAKRSVKPVEDAQKRQKEFIAAASHELKSPLAVITSNVDVMESVGGDIQSSTQNIRSEAMRMSGLVEDMLILAGAETGKWTIKKSPTNMEDVLAQAYERYLPVAMKKGVVLRLVLPDDALPLISADEERIVQILIILLSNAVNYSASKSEIIIEGKHHQKNVLLIVKDSGQGIADKDKAHIFDSFYRADRSHSKKGHYGLGLAVAKELVVLHSGTIAVSDTPGGGATFTVRLPKSNEDNNQT